MPPMAVRDILWPSFLRRVSCDCSLDPNDFLLSFLLVILPPTVPIRMSGPRFLVLVFLDPDRMDVDACFLSRTSNPLSLRILDTISSSLSDPPDIRSLSSS